MATAFELHPQLDADTVALTEWPLCRVLLMNDAQYPWAILVPRRKGIREIYELDAADQLRLQRECSALGRALMQIFDGHKLNLAALGNMVPQLHVHVIVRFRSDPAWPAPVWGRMPAQRYTPRALDERVALLRRHLAPPV